MSEFGSVLYELIDLIGLATERGVLRRVVCSKPTSSDCIRKELTLRTIGGKQMYQMETFYKDNKARHLNIALSATEVLFHELAGYRQINLLTTVAGADCEYKWSASGKETLLRGGKLRQRER